MTTPVFATHPPAESLLRAAFDSADFCDSYTAPLIDAEATPAEIFLRIARATPDWVSRLMAIRNALARRIGLRDVGAMRDATERPAIAYRIGDRMGIFDVSAIDERELVLGIDDSHLDVRVSVLKDDARYTVTTVVHIKNWIGRSYMAPVGRIHPLVVRAMMRRAAP
ncbi:DUF2867 domain-containing protein [Methylosinus sp. Sm6]|uniref:DUF2867 domain-containing protein n=1 Tax=Methylosinus sp. Sm6 TaxID=2866948 RepID=UPI001C99BCAD|nr:DUF2867 domain-containing protein [Methylosinus sp. Sm6]MBY6242769.1 DUF2867 domain-containing protein [Methylosinus sp. Sm6]